MKNKKKNNNANPLGYRSEEDRSYGLAGMAISLASLDALDRVASVSIDYAGPMVRFTGEFYYGGSPSVSPKATWRRLIENFQLTSSLAVSNVLARCLMRDGGSDPSEMLEHLFGIMRDEGSEVCQLENDEIENFIANVVGRANRIFGNPRLRPLLSDLAGTLRNHRELSGRSLAEEMHMLRLI